MSGGIIDRPAVEFDAASHTYKVEGEDVLGVSTIAKVGGVEDTWGIASAWGFRIGYEGAHDLLSAEGVLDEHWGTKDDLREELKARGLTPWATRDRAANRGTAVHDVLERLADDASSIPSHGEIEAMPEAERGHVRSIIRWYLEMRPKFVATEVQVASREHRFAGRYDLRVSIDARRILPCIDPLREDAQAVRVRELAEEGEMALVLLDLKTSKGIYPTTHFPQLEGYEGAGVEMGFPATDVRAVLNTNEDGSYSSENFAVSWATYQDFLSFAGALRAIRRIRAGDPEMIRAKRQEEALMANLPARSRDLAALGLPELAGLDSRSVGRILGKLRKRGKVRQDTGGVWVMDY